MKNPNKITFGITEKNAVTFVIDPSYTSQSQLWKGNVPSLKSIDTEIKQQPDRTIKE